MNEPKKRGRPTNAEIAAREAAKQVPGSGPTVNGDTAGQLERVEDERGDMRSDDPEMQAFIDERRAAVADLHARATSAGVADDRADRAQAYAMRVWSGQSVSLNRTDRIKRATAAVAGQNLPIDALKFPGGADDEDWTEEDEQPVTWRKARA
jgi:hypothetical protein